MRYDEMNVSFKNHRVTHYYAPLFSPKKKLMCHLYSFKLFHCLTVSGNDLTDVKRNSDFRFINLLRNLL